jgi:hypothetical protein
MYLLRTSSFALTSGEGADAGLFAGTMKTLASEEAGYK